MGKESEIKDSLAQALDGSGESTIHIIERNRDQINTNLELLDLIKAVHPAQLSYSKEMETIHESQTMNEALRDFISDAFENGEEGERFKSDYWKNRPGWGVDVPDVIEHNQTVYFESRWWNWIGGFVYTVSAMRAQAEIGDSSIHGYVLFEKGRGYAPNTQIFVDDEGNTYEFEREVIHHEPSRLEPTGGLNVGSTETKIKNGIRPIRGDDEKVISIMDIMSSSIRHLETDGLSPIMKNHFSL